MNKRFAHLLKKETTVVFDVDGVLAAFEFGELKHNGCRDEVFTPFSISPC